MLTTKPATNPTATLGLDTVALKISRTVRALIALTLDTVRYKLPAGRRCFINVP